MNLASLVSFNLLNQLPLNRRFEREIFFIVCLGIAGYSWLALASYNPFDPSIYSASFPKVPVHNLAGTVGAQIAALLVYWLGACAFVVPVPCVVTGYFVLIRQHKPFGLTRVLGWICGYICLLCIGGTYVSTVEFKNVTYPFAGLTGETFSKFAVALFGKWGTPVIAATLTFCALMLVIRKSLGEIAQAFWQQFVTWRTQLVSSWSQFWTKLRFQKEPEERPYPDPTRQQPSIEKSPLTPISEVEPSHPNLDGLYTQQQNSAYAPPPPTIFKTNPSGASLTTSVKEALDGRAKLLCSTFEDFGVKGTIAAIQPGPVLTVFEFQPDAGTKITKVTSLADDLALALKVDSIIMQPVRGKRAIGVQVPNSQRETVRFGDLVNAQEFQCANSPLTLAMGKSISGEPFCADLSKMPHLLMAGATGAGKSVAINALLCSVIMKSSPRQVRMILVDPKMLELSVYGGIPHLLMPVITEPSRAALALKWATNEMERRYQLMRHAKVRNLANFNDYWRAADEHERQSLRDVLKDDELDELPTILLVIDELADLMLTAPKDVESLIQRLAQKARASGIHLVLATQRPSVDVITGVIKANLPCRAAFQVVSKHDSRTIIDQIGADKLLGNGDMLLQRPGVTRLERIQGAFISDDEVIQMVQAIKDESQPTYDKKLISWIDEEASKQSGSDSNIYPTDPEDPKFDLAVQIAATTGSVSASYLQRQLKIGYNRAARIVEIMEAQGMIGPVDGAKPRQWLGPSL